MPLSFFMPHFAHLIFDLDGTLVDTQADLAAATNYMLRVLELPALSARQVKDYIGYGARVLVERALGADYAHLVPRGVALFMAYYETHLLDQTRAYAGIARLLATAQNHGLRLSVLTNKPEGPSRAILLGVQLTSFFTAVVGGDTLPVKKPHPQGVFYLQHLTGVELTETLLIGDSSIDIETGCAAGIATCGVTWGYGAKSLLSASPHFLVDTPDQLHPLILA